MMRKVILNFYVNFFYILRNLNLLVDSEIE